MANKDCPAGTEAKAQRSTTERGGRAAVQAACVGRVGGDGLFFTRIKQGKIR